jgi:hypothetical protein
MLRASYPYALDALGRLGACRHAAMHPASAVRHRSRSAGRTLTGAVLRYLNGGSSMARYRLAWKRRCSLFVARRRHRKHYPMESRSEHAGRQIGPMVQCSPERRIPWKNQSQSKFDRLTRLR